LIRRVEAMPGVTSVSASSVLPLTSNVLAPYLAEGQPVVPIGQRPLAAWNSISPGYFKTLGIPLLRGRDFAWADDDKSPQRVIVSESLARRFWPEEDPIGRHITYARRQVVAEIVGVAADVKSLRLDSEPGMVFYTSYPQFAWPNFSITLRTEVDPRAFLHSAPAEVFAMDRNLPVINPQTAEQVIDQSISQQRQTVFLITGFAVVALLLAIVGLYGLMAYSVTQRTVEIGIRQAVGAQRAQVLGMFLTEGLKLSLLGICLGTAASLAATRLLSGLLFHVSATDPFTYAGISLLFLAVTLAASSIPAFRATRVDPLEALRRSA
jgi:putative ABC transport system permease protein